MPYHAITSLTEFEQTVELSVSTESRFLEFKREYGWKGATAQAKHGLALEVCRDIAQFANAQGGVLLVGISEMAASDGGAVADAIVSVPDVEGLIAWVQQPVRNHLVPATFELDSAVISVRSDKVVAFNVPPNVHLVALWANGDRRGIEYLCRGNRGNIG